MRRLLLVRRAEITRSQASQLAEFNDPDGKGHLADLEELSESADDDSFCEILGIQESTVAQIDEALAKIEAGSYGFCEECDQPIGRPRLEALPFASLCISCQRERERSPRPGDED